MRRTSTLQASAAAFGLMAGFAMTPDAPSPLERSVTPYAVAVAWRTSEPPEQPVAGVQADDWGGRLPTTQARARAEGRPKLAPMRARGPVRPAPAARPAPRKAEGTARPLVTRDVDLVAAAPGVERRECPRHRVHTRHIVHTRQS